MGKGRKSILLCKDGFLVVSGFSIRIGLYSICLAGFASLMAGLAFVLISPIFTQSILVFQVNLESKLLFVVAAFATMAILFGCCWNGSPTWRLFQVLAVAIPLTVAVSLICLLVAQSQVIALIVLGASLGMLVYQWLNVFFRAHAFVCRRGYSLMSRCQIIAGLGLMVLLATFPLFSLVAVHALFILSFVLGIIALYAIRSSEPDEEGGDANGGDGVLRGANISAKALAIVFGYAVLIGLCADYNLEFGLLDLAAFLVAVCTAVLGVVLYLFCERNFARRLMEESIRFFVSVAAAVALGVSVFYGSWFCTAMLAVGAGLGFTVVFLRLGYFFKAALADNIWCYKSIGLVLCAFLLGVLVGTVLSTLLFAIPDNRTLGGIILVGLSIAIGAMSVGRGGYNLQADFIREVEDQESLEAANRLFYEKACETISREYGLTKRQAEVLQYLGDNKNASYIQDKLVISSHTAKSHIYAVFGKMGIHSQQELIAIVEEQYKKEKKDAR